MKEHPILFSGSMVQAILKGQKTQTRRVLKLAPGERLEESDGHFRYFADEGKLLKCPYGGVGDRLWVRETWSVDAVCMYPCPQVWYRADDSIDRDAGHTCPNKSQSRYADCLACWEGREGRKFQWKPSIFMKRHHSRITLQTVSISVQRLQNITPADAIAEGIGHQDVDAAVVSYASLWDRINGKGSWDCNPWVWVVEFKRLEVSL
jgi:hypothetical protein